VSLLVRLALLTLYSPSVSDCKCACNIVSVCMQVCACDIDVASVCMRHRCSKCVHPTSWGGLKPEYVVGGHLLDACQDKQEVLVTLHQRFSQ